LLGGLGARLVRGKALAGQRLHLAWLDGRRVGVVAKRDDCHMFRLFVGARLQRRGIVGQLWQRTRRDAVRRAGTRRIALNAAAAAVPVYRRLGFVPSGPLAISPGRLATRPMPVDRR
jgi:GNAT superfamily N-acetyltransferase